MAIKEKSGLARGLNSGHVSPHRPIQATKSRQKRFISRRQKLIKSVRFTESHPPRVQTPRLAHQGPFEQAHGVREGDCEGGFGVCGPYSKFSSTENGFASGLIREQVVGEDRVEGRREMFGAKDRVSIRSIWAKDAC